MRPPRIGAKYANTRPRRAILYACPIRRILNAPIIPVTPVTISEKRQDMLKQDSRLVE